MLYRILTELKNKENVAAIMSRYFDGFSLIEATGYWKLHREQSLIVEVETDELDKVSSAASKIKKHNCQEAVLIQQLANHAWYV
jgi:uncharacterized membrane-anchored protein YitT (DUF2179 family)